MLELHQMAEVFDRLDDAVVISALPCAGAADASTLALAIVSVTGQALLSMQVTQSPRTSGAPQPDACQTPLGPTAFAPTPEQLEGAIASIVRDRLLVAYDEEDIRLITATWPALFEASDGRYLLLSREFHRIHPAARTDTIATCVAYLGYASTGEDALGRARDTACCLRALRAEHAPGMAPNAPTCDPAREWLNRTLDRQYPTPPAADHDDTEPAPGPKGSSLRLALRNTVVVLASIAIFLIGVMVANTLITGKKQGETVWETVTIADGATVKIPSTWKVNHKDETNCYLYGEDGIFIFATYTDFDADSFPGGATTFDECWGSFTDGLVGSGTMSMGLDEVEVADINGARRYRCWITYDDKEHAAGGYADITLTGDGLIMVVYTRRDRQPSDVAEEAVAWLDGVEYRELSRPVYVAADST